MTEATKNTDMEPKNASATMVLVGLVQALRSALEIRTYWKLLAICGEITGLSLIYYHIMAGPMTVMLFAPFVVQSAALLLIYQLNFLYDKAFWTRYCRLVFIGAGLCAVVQGGSYLVKSGNNSWALIVLCILTGATVAFHEQIYRRNWQFAILVVVSLATGVLGFIFGLKNEQDLSNLSAMYVFQWATIVVIWQSKLADVKFDAILTRIWLVVYICAGMVVLYWGVNSLLKTNDDSLAVCVHMALNGLTVLLAIVAVIAQEKADAELQKERMEF